MYAMIQVKEMNICGQLFSYRRISLKRRLRTGVLVWCLHQQCEIKDAVMKTGMHGISQSYMTACILYHFDRSCPGC